MLWAGLHRVDVDLSVSIKMGESCFRGNTGENLGSFVIVMFKQSILNKSK